MTTYNYSEEMYNDIYNYINDEININNYTDRDEMETALYDDFFVNDSITGNASGSYWFNTYKAEEAIAHNLDLLAEACAEFGSDMDLLKDGAEACDVTIRCYLLGSVLPEVLDDMENGGELVFDEDEEA